MGWFKWLVLFLVPLIVLYTIGYFVPGFSALTISWILGLALIITIAEGIFYRVLGSIVENRFAKGVIDFLVATFVIFTVSSAIEGGRVPFWGALLSAVIIAILSGFIKWDHINVK